MGHDRAAAFTYDRGVGDTFRVAHFHDVVDDVVAIFLERIVGRAVEAGPRPVVIDSEPPANIEVTELMAHLGKFRVIAGRFAHRALDRGDVGHLRADMEMDELEAMREPRGL